MEFLAWNPEHYGNLKSISDTTVIFVAVGLAITYFVYRYVRKKGCGTLIQGTPKTKDN